MSGERAVLVAWNGGIGLSSSPRPGYGRWTGPSEGGLSLGSRDSVRFEPLVPTHSDKSAPGASATLTTVALIN